MQISVLWLLAFWILGYWILPCLLDLAGYERDDLSRRGQALLHLILDVGQLGFTIAILWKRLKAYRPRSLGWFETRLLPIQQWLGPVIVAAASFPLLNIVAQQAQVSAVPVCLHLMQSCTLMRACCIAADSSCLECCVGAELSEHQGPE